MKRFLPLLLLTLFATLALIGCSGATAVAGPANLLSLAEAGQLVGELADETAALPPSQETMTMTVPISPTMVAQPGGALPADAAIELVKVADGLTDPINVVAAPDDSGRLFVVERPGTVRIVQDGEVLEEPFLDISGDTLSAFLEQGLYDLEFHPDFAENGRFFVHYAELLRNGDSLIVEYQVSADNPDQADPESARAILQIDQPWANHNGGELAFGPDGYLYIGSGDGGWEGDPLEAGQDLSTLLGKILRIDVDTDDGRPYAIPDDNPFADDLQPVRLFGISEETFAAIHTEARPEIWAYGLRNPWKFNFDPQTGDLYIAEVGQNEWEEIDLQPADSNGGENYGWDFNMGTHCFPIQEENCAQVGVLPIAEYNHDLGCAVVGIGVYRGPATELDGVYLAGDYCSGRVWGLAMDDGGQWQMEELLDTRLQLTGSGQDAEGNLYVTSCNCNYGGPSAAANPPGALWQVVPRDEVADDAETAANPATSRSIALEEIVSGFAAPVALRAAPDDSGRLFVVDQAGVIWVVDEEGQLLDDPFLNLGDSLVELNDGFDERGLLGLAFHPDYAENGRFYVYYSAPMRDEAPDDWDHTSHISEFTVSADDPNTADPASERLLLQVDQPQFNHDGGQIAFGPDGYLYIPLGDGGQANDEGLGHVPDWYEVNAGGNGQDLSANLLGSILRIDVDGGDDEMPYGIPDDNPFVDVEGAEEVWAYGFRNPFRIAFDTAGDGQLFVGDAGQNRWEEVSIVTAGGNYGWNVKEGAHCFSSVNPDEELGDCPDTGADGEPLIDPIIEYLNANQTGGLGLVVIGGDVYRGQALPDFQGDYIFGDWSTSFGQGDGRLFVATPATDDGAMWPMEELWIDGREDGRLGEYLLSFGQDSDGELYILTTETSGPTGATGKVYKITPPPAASDEQSSAQSSTGELPPPEDEAVLNYVTEVNPYTEWGTWPADQWNDFDDLLVSAPPHGAIVRIYVNEVALAAADSFDGTLPPGSLIVKENYTNSDPDNPGELAALTLMYKVEGFNPEANNWFWLKSPPSGPIESSGAVQGCIECHSQPDNHDYVLRYGFGEEPAVTSLNDEG